MGRGEGPVRLAIVGAGNRGRHVYAAWCRRHPEEARVVAVADPDPVRRAAVGDDHRIAPSHRHARWEALLADVSDIDGVVVATPDRLHVGPAVAALDRGLDVLLEKPVATDVHGLAALRAAARGATGRVTVAHVLRYTPFFRTLERLLDEGAIGTLTGIVQQEDIGHQHFAHSYVRGNWRRTDLAAPMILSKACHDLDLLRWLAGAPWTVLASVGGLTHFHAGNAPEGAPERCLDGCAIEDTCPFHAGRYYLEDLAGWDGWPIPVLTEDPSPEGRRAALEAGPYGRCVYRCDNDVADHQVVTCAFANGVTATLTVSAFTATNTRRVRLLGTHGELAGDLEDGVITLRRFGAATPRRGDGEGPTQVVRVGGGRPREGVPAGVVVGHAGGDDGLMAAFVAQVRRGPAGREPAAPTSLEDAVDSHLMAFAAERARLTGRLVRAEDQGLDPP